MYEEEFSQIINAAMATIREANLKGHVFYGKLKISDNSSNYPINLFVIENNNQDALVYKDISHAFVNLSYIATKDSSWVPEFIQLYDDAKQYLKEYNYTQDNTSIKKINIMKELASKLKDKMDI